MAEIVKKGEESLADLKILQPEENFILVGGSPVFVKPYTFAKLLKALKYLNNLAGILQTREDGLEPSLLEAFSKHGDDVLGLLALATDKPLEFFDELDAGIGLDLAILTYKVNESFFSEKLIPKIESLMQSDSTENQTPNETEEQDENLKSKSKAKKAGSTSSKN